MPYKEKGRKKNPWRGTVTFKGERHSEMFATEREVKRWEAETLQTLKELGQRRSVLFAEVSKSFFTVPRFSPIYAVPVMRSFLRQHGQESGLVVVPESLQAGSLVQPASEVSS